MSEKWPFSPFLIDVLIVLKATKRPSPEITGRPRLPAGNGWPGSLSSCQIRRVLPVETSRTQALWSLPKVTQRPQLEMSPTSTERGTSSPWR